MRIHKKVFKLYLTSVQIYTSHTYCMYCSPFVKPYHLPILVAMSFILLTHTSDARVTNRVKKHHHTNHTTSPAVKPTPFLPQKIIAFTRKMYSELGNSTEMHVTPHFQNEFDQLDAYTNGQLGHTLSALFEMRLIDLQMSIRRARIMRDAVHQFVLGSSLTFPDQHFSS